MNDITILYDMPIHTDREISTNRPDIVIKNNRDKKCTLVGNRNYPSMWQMKTEIIPVVVGALGVIKKGSEKLVREIPGNFNLWEI